MFKTITDFFYDYTTLGFHVQYFFTIKSVVKDFQHHFSHITAPTITSQELNH